MMARVTYVLLSVFNLMIVTVIIVIIIIHNMMNVETRAVCIILYSRNVLVFKYNNDFIRVLPGTTMRKVDLGSAAGVYRKKVNCGSHYDKSIVM